jgi:hypothetical protein
MQNKRRFNYSFILLILLVTLGLFIWFVGIEECYKTGKLISSELYWYAPHPGIPKKIDYLLGRVALEISMFLFMIGRLIHYFVLEYLSTNKDCLVFMWLLNFGCWIIGTEFLTDSLRRSLMSKEEILFILLTILYVVLYHGTFFSFGGNFFSLYQKDLVTLWYMSLYLYTISNYRYKDESETVKNTFVVFGAIFFYSYFVLA